MTVYVASNLLRTRDDVLYQYFGVGGGNIINHSTVNLF